MCRSPACRRATSRTMAKSIIPTCTACWTNSAIPAGSAANTVRVDAPRTALRGCPSITNKGLAMNVLITGGAGFLGQKLARALLARGTLSGADGSQQQIGQLVLADVVPADD